MPLRPLILVALVLLGGLGLVPAQAQEWEVVTVNRQEYVTLSSFCRFYGFDYRPVAAGESFRARSKTHELRIGRADAREVTLNGVRVWLSFPVETVGGQWLISKTDVVACLEPLLRPQRVAGRRKWAGVVIDPGHGGSDNGARSYRNTFEKSYALDTSFRLEQALKKAGVRTVLTRRSDVFISLEERAVIASRYRDYLFVSMHYNFAHASARGIETYVLTPRGAGSTNAAGRVRQSDFQRLPGNARDPLNVLLGMEIHRELIGLHPKDPEVDRGLKRARFVVLKDNALPAVLVEGGFLTNRMEANLIHTEAYRQRLAEATARGILNFMRLTGGGSSGGEAETELAIQAPATNAQTVKAPPVAPAATSPPQQANAPTPRPPSAVLREEAVAVEPPAVPKFEPSVTIYPVPREAELPPEQSEGEAGESSQKEREVEASGTPVPPPRSQAMPLRNRGREGKVASLFFLHRHQEFV